MENSWHLTGDAADYDGPNLGALKSELQAHYGPKARVFIHKGHVHAQRRGLGAPYYGQRGTKGLRGR